MACNVKPGDTQIDTVAHCGGDMRGNFFWTLTQTDRPTQWTEITPTWNRGMYNTVEALKRLERRFPFPVASEHEDNGPEFINYAMTVPLILSNHFLGRHCIFISEILSHEEEVFLWGF